MFGLWLDNNKVEEYDFSTPLFTKANPREYCDALHHTDFIIYYLKFVLLLKSTCKMSKIGVIC